MYPMITPETELFTISDELGELFVVNTPEDVAFPVSRHLYYELCHADGTHPINEDDEVLANLEEKGILTRKRYLGNGIMRYLLLPIKKPRNWLAGKLYQILDHIIPYAALPVFLAGLVWFLMAVKLECSFSWAGYIVLFLLAEAAHLLGHYVAYVTHNEGVHSAILYFSFLIIPVNMDYDLVSVEKELTRREEAHLCLAGLEFQAVLTGILFALDAWRNCFSVCGAAAMVSMCCMIMDLLPANDINDGGKALFRALGLEKLGEAAGKILRSRENRKKLLNGGKTGRKIFALCLTVIVSRVMTALLLLAGVCAMVWSFCS